MLRILVLLAVLALLVGCVALRKQKCRILGAPGTNWDACHPFLKTDYAYQGFGIQMHAHEFGREQVAHLLELEPGLIRVDLDVPADAADSELYERAVRAAAAINARMIFTLGYRDRNGARFMTSRRYWDQMSVLCEKVRVTCLRWRVKYAWELWNEPNHDMFWGAEPEVYTHYADIMVTEIREFDDKGCILGPALAGIDWKWLEEAVDCGLFDLVDGLTIHPYRKDPPETLARDVERLMDLLCQWGEREKPIVFGEFGYPTESYERASDLMARVWQVCGWSDVRMMVWYQFQEDEGHPENGLLDRDGRETPLYWQFLSLSQNLRDVARREGGI